MQTFLPDADFVRSARVLDDRRLGKQRVEALQVLRALHLDGYGWANHPAVTMWRGHTAALVAYGLAIVDAWVARGYDDRTRANIAEFAHPDPPPSQPALGEQGRLPPWLGREDLHRSHRSALLRKAPAHYLPYFGDTPADLPYVWPEPPAPPPVRGPRSAWVVRSISETGVVAFAARAGEAVPAGGPEAPRRMTKRQRQVHRFVHDMARGDLVVVPGDELLEVCVVTGDHEIAGGHHLRSVERIGPLARGDLRFPAALQDPQEVFPLHDEPALAILVR